MKTGETIKIGNRTGIVYYVNHEIKCYQVMFGKRYGEIISYKRAEKEKIAN